MILQLKDIQLTREKNRILNGVSLDIAEGCFFVLMGPTGCGKTTLLRLAGLLERPDSGDILFNGSVVPRRGSELLKTRRRVATMFQSPVMFRGTVFSNIAWGLKIRRIPQSEMVNRVEQILELAGLSGFGERDASTLSGGEMRRTALARALVLEPDLLILDEPTTSLDPAFKRDLLTRIKEIHAETGTTFLMATHDFTDALAVGTRGAVMRGGLIEQTGSMDEILFKPENHFMASFTGMRNIFPAEFSGSEARVGELDVAHSGKGDKTGHGFLAIPPEAVVLSLSTRVTSERNRFTGTVSSIERHGTNWDVVVAVADLSLTVAITTGALDELSISSGSRIHISFKASAVRLF
ncbi:MAG: ABC transporter ATP-binding protein [Candidatus Sabulitectum sp.]|nr:ABC transporter ATP-binding protein [Candidatus Sabulitectum sp.]